MGILSGISDFLSGGANSQQAGASQAAVDALAGLQTPDVEQMRLQLEELIQQGVITPEQAATFQQQRTGMEEISLDPRLQQAQQDALSSLQDIGQNKGLTDMDRAQLSQIQSQEQAKARGSREAILQNAQARGMGGSGLELMSQLQNQQEAVNRASARDTDVAGQAQQRALAALQGAGQLGGQMGQQSFQQQADIKSAQDRINQFNVQNQQQTGNLNTAARNQAQEANLAAKQRVADVNVATRNQQQTANKQLAQQDFENKYKKAGGLAGTYQNQAGMYGQQGAATTGMVGSLIQAGGTAAAAASDERVKENVEEFDPSSFLDGLTGYKYDYKSPGKHGQGKQVGVMAQDVEKGAPQGVSEDADGTKVIDYNKMGGPILASLAEMNARLKKVEGK